MVFSYWVALSETKSNQENILTIHYFLEFYRYFVSALEKFSLHPFSSCCHASGTVCRSVEKGSDQTGARGESPEYSLTFASITHLIILKYF